MANRVYTKRGDDGTTGLWSGERVQKDDSRIELLGAIDEAQSFLGLARAENEQQSPLEELLVRLERDLWILMAEVATSEAATQKRVPGESAVSAEMVQFLEHEIDRRLEAEHPPSAFSVPGEHRLSASLDVARTVVRRAERQAIAVSISPVALAYLNRLSDLCWVLARESEQERRVQRRVHPRRA